MRIAIQLAALWIGLLTAPAQAVVAKLDRLSFHGTEYVRLEDWARASGYQFRWTVPKEEVRITLMGGTLQFTVDSRKMSVKGVNVWLGAPIAYRNGFAYAAAADLNQTIVPLLSPPRNPPGKTIKTIVLDPGHGGKDPGNQEGRRQEKQYTLTFARELAELLKKAGFKVSLTRNSDTFVELADRPEIARRRQADLFLVLHFNSADGAGASAVNGAEVYCMTPARTSSTNARGEGAQTGAYPGNRFDSRNVLLAYQIQKALSTRAGSEDRGVKRARFAVLRTAEMPSAYIEAAFMTHPTDAKRIYEPARRRALAQGIVEGVIAYKSSVQR
jgi:N-acetylmuramoyl-L-alanine amidase